MHRQRKLVERVFRWCALGFSITAVVCGVVSVTLASGDVVFSASLIVAAVVFGLAAYVCIATLGFLEVYRPIRKEIGRWRDRADRTAKDGPKTV